MNMLKERRRRLQRRSDHLKERLRRRKRESLYIVSNDLSVLFSTSQCVVMINC